MQYYKSCSELPIYNFYKIIDEGNYGYLQKKYKDDSPFVEPSKEEGDIFLKIMEEYSELTSNKESLVSLKLQIHITTLEFERDSLKSIVEAFSQNKDFEVLLLLSEFGFKVSEGSDIDKLLKSVISKIKGLNNKIRINKVKYTNRFDKTKKEIKRNLDKEALTLEMSLELGREINVRKTSVSKWVNMISISNEKAKRLARLNSN